MIRFAGVWDKAVNVVRLGMKLFARSVESHPTKPPIRTIGDPRDIYLA